MSKKQRKRRVVGRAPQTRQTIPAEIKQQEDQHGHWHLYKNGEPMQELEKGNFEVAIPQACKNCGQMLVPVVVYLHPEYKEALDELMAEREIHASAVIEQLFAEGGYVSGFVDE